MPWLVTVRSSGLRELTRPPVDAFFETVVEVPALGAADAAELLATRLRGRLSVRTWRTSCQRLPGIPDDC